MRFWWFFWLKWQLLYTFYFANRCIASKLMAPVHSYARKADAKISKSPKNGNYFFKSLRSSSNCFKIFSSKNIIDKIITSSTFCERVSLLIGNHSSSICQIWVCIVVQSFGSLPCSDGNKQNFFSSSALQVLLKVLMWLSPSINHWAMTSIHPLTL